MGLYYPITLAKADLFASQFEVMTRRTGSVPDADQAKLTENEFIGGGCTKQKNWEQAIAKAQAWIDHFKDSKKQRGIRSKFVSGIGVLGLEV